MVSEQFPSSQPVVELPIRTAPALQPEKIRLVLDFGFRRFGQLRWVFVHGLWLGDADILALPPFAYSAAVGGAYAYLASAKKCAAKGRAKNARSLPSPAEWCTPG